MKIAKDGRPFVFRSTVVAVSWTAASWYFHLKGIGYVAGILWLLTAFCAYFFRDPSRTIPVGDHLILSPADGKVVDISEGRDPSWNEPVWLLRIFLSVFEPHLQRSPIQGRVRAIAYKKGRFLDARDPKAHFENEQNRIEIQPSNSAIRGPIVVTQIAGLIARRIVCWVKETEEVQAGQQIGLIRFGSQVDMVIPKSMKIRIKTGDHVTAGDTIIAEVG